MSMLYVVGYHMDDSVGFVSFLVIAYIDDSIVSVSDCFWG